MATLQATPSSKRPILSNTTNTDAPEPLGLCSPSPDGKRPSDRNWLLGPRKRVKTQHLNNRKDASSDESDSDVDVEKVVVSRARRNNAIGIRDAWMSAGPSSRARLPQLPTRCILQSFVSNNKCDVFKSHSIHDDSYMSPPYACAYTNGAKEGKNALLAVSTEQGVVHVLNTAKRQEWDVEPQRTTLHIHENGIFDVQWSPTDRFLATASADKSVAITAVTESRAINLCTLVHHMSTLKCVAWDPARPDCVLASGSRDGMVCIWDLRVSPGEGSAGDSDGRLRTPVLVVPKAHETSKAAAGRKSRTKITAVPSRGVTSVLFPAHDTFALISSGSYDGILRLWDLRSLNPRRTRNSSVSQSIPKSLSTSARLSSSDPTTFRGLRARGITSVTPSPTTGLLYALGTDSRIHTYDARTLEPLSAPPIPSSPNTSSSSPDDDRWSWAHPNMRTNSFYVRMSVSPSGRWIASGGSQRGSVFLFDVASSETTANWTRGWKRGEGAELKGQRGEVGAVDWAHESVGLATCADDGTVRVWREDLDVYRKCVDEREKMKWSWCWAVDQ